MIVPADKDLLAHGYAPGGYIITCVDCQARDWDLDKRAIRCRGCAVIRFEAAASGAKQSMHECELSPKPENLPGIGSMWQHKKGTYYRVVGLTRGSENPEQWRVSYQPFAGGDDWSRIAQGRPGEGAYFLDEERFAFIGGPRTWKDERPPEPELPSAKDLLELLDNVSASAENMLVAHGKAMTPADVLERTRIVNRARAVCDALLRPEAV